MTGDYFRTLGITSLLGRTLQPADDDPPATVVVLSYDLWRGRFAAAEGIVGQAVRMGGRPFEIVGVAQKGFNGVSADFGAVGTRVWVPLGNAPSFAPAVRWFAPAPRPGTTVRPERERRELAVIGRLRTGVNVETAAAEISLTAAGLDSAYPRTIPNPGSQAIPPRAWSARTLADVRTEESEHIQRFGFVVAGLVFLVLAVACTNLANLVLARGTSRQQELAVRRALGAARWRLVREQASESVLVALAGGIGAYVLMRGLAAAVSVELPLGGGRAMSLQPEIDVPVLLMGAAALVVSLVVFGLEPAIQLTRARDVRGLLAEGAGVGAPKAKRQRVLLRWL